MTREFEFTCNIRLLAPSVEAATEVIRDYFKTFGMIEDSIIPDGVLSSSVDLNPIA